VNNGGFLQYFESWSGESANFAPPALRAIGAEVCANIVQRALAAVSPDPLPDDQDERARLLESVPDTTRSALEDLDSEFFSYPDDLTELLFTYVAAHPDAFGDVPGENV
jgi:hypothetical protein